MFRWRRSIGLARVAAVLALLIASGNAAPAEDRLLKQAVDFNGAITYLATKVPGFLLVAVRNGETAIAGFGDIADKRGKTPDGDYLDYFVEVKQREVQAAHEQITPWELERYLQLF